LTKKVFISGQVKGRVLKKRWFPGWRRPGWKIMNFKSVVEMIYSTTCQLQTYMKKTKKGLLGPYS
jgi:hypothetical protein